MTEQWRVVGPIDALHERLTKLEQTVAALTAAAGPPTTPTQAQIEAAAEQLMYLFTQTIMPSYRQMAEVALTAAAEVATATAKSD